MYSIELMSHLENACQSACNRAPNFTGRLTTYRCGDNWRAGLLTDDEILARLFRLNQQRAGK